MKVGVASSELLKLLAIINVLLVARPKQQPEIASEMTIAFRQQPVQHGTERRDPGSGGNEYGVTQRRVQDEIAERTLKLNLCAWVEIAEIVRHESILYSIQAEGKKPILGGRRGDGIRARHLFALGSAGFHREPLSGNKAEAGYAANFEFDMLCELG